MTFEGSYKAPDNSDVLPITHRSFDNDAIMFTDTPGSTLTLRGRKSGHGVKIDFEGFKYIGVWSAANDAPFVALELGPVTPPCPPRTTSLSTRSTPSPWPPALPINAALASPCSRGSAARSMLRAVQSDNLSFKRQGIDLLVMPCLFHATCSLWTSLAGIAKTSTSPMTTMCLLIFRACAALLVAGVYPVKSSAYDSTGKADYAFSPTARHAGPAGVQSSHLFG